MSAQIDDLTLRLQAVLLLLFANYDGRALLSAELTDEQRGALQQFVASGEKEICQLADGVNQAMRILGESE